MHLCLVVRHWHLCAKWIHLICLAMFTFWMSYSKKETIQYILMLGLQESH